MHVAAEVQRKKLIHCRGTYGVLVCGYRGATLPPPGMNSPCHATAILYSLLNDLFSENII
jgi:hypothetical protein